MEGMDRADRPDARPEGGAEAATARLRTAVAAIVIPSAIGLAALASIVVALLGARARAVHRFYLTVARLGLRIGSTRLELRGADSIAPATPYVVVANHESAWDPLCVVAAMPSLVLRFVAKREIMRIPLFGHALRLTGNVTVVRNDTEGDVRRIAKKMERRDPEVSMLFFAEGTRARDGALHPFKMGAFSTALQHGLPILPIGIAGTYRIWPKGTVRLRPGPVVIEVGEPIPVNRLGLDGRAALRDLGFIAVRDLRARARTRLRELGVEPGGID